MLSCHKEFVNVFKRTYYKPRVKMKWKNEIPNKTEFMKANSFHFIENEKFHGEQVHERNVGKIQPPNQISQRKEVKKTANLDSSTAEKENKESRTMSKTITLTKTKTDFEGSAPRRYTTKCFIRPVTTPVWYTESLFLNIGSTKKKHTEQIYFKEKFVPFQWSENMETETKTGPKCIYSELIIPVEEPEDNIHFVSLEPQQRAAKSTDL